MSWRRIAKPPTLARRIDAGRLVLRPFHRGDADDLFAYARDEEWSRYITPPYPYQRDHADRFIAERINGHGGEWAGWCIDFDGRMAGSVDLILDARNRAADLAYSLDRRLWNRGLITEAVGAAMKAAFTGDPPLNRLVARVDTRNAASARVAEKLGMMPEGILRQCRWHKGRFVDETVFAILREAWIKDCHGRDRA